jgi:hypothetical protein
MAAFIVTQTQRKVACAESGFLLQERKQINHLAKAVVQRDLNPKNAAPI